MTTTVKERPILFSGPMVRAILEGRKTQTRRVLRHQLGPLVESLALCGPAFGKAEGAFLEYVRSGKSTGFFHSCPYGKQGDRLWVRETWCPALNRSREALYRADGGTVFKSDANDQAKLNKDGRPASPWRPSIHMPRWASRLTLEVVEIRAERLQEITAKDVYAEGVGEFVQSNLDVAREMFAQLWNSINAERGFGWEKNPWVWVVEFKTVPRG